MNKCDHHGGKEVAEPTTTDRFPGLDLRPHVAFLRRGRF